MRCIFFARAISPRWCVHAYRRGFLCECICSSFLDDDWQMVIANGCICHLTCSERLLLCHLPPLCLWPLSFLIFQCVRVFIWVLFITGNISLKQYLLELVALLLLLCTVFVLGYKRVNPHVLGALVSFLKLFVTALTTRCHPGISAGSRTGVQLNSSVCQYSMEVSRSVCTHHTNRSAISTLQTSLNIYSAVLLGFVLAPLLFIANNWWWCCESSTAAVCAWTLSHVVKAWS